MANRVVTIEIDSTAVKIMETRAGKVIKWASLALEPTTIEGGVVSDPQALSATVKQLMTSSGIKAKTAIASVSGLYSVSRILAVPTPAGGVTTSQAILDAVNEAMPLGGGRLYLSWQTITTGEGVQQVFAVGVPRDAIDTEVRALRAAGINPHLLDLKAMALVRAVNKAQAIILSIEPSTLDIIMVVNGIPEIMRTTAWHWDNLTVEGKAEHLAVSLDLTVGFYNSHHTDTPLDPATPLIITGQMSGDLTLIENLQARVQYPIEPIAPPLECPEHLPISQYAVNIGLALKGTTLPKYPGQGGYLPPDINLLPEAYRPWKPTIRQIYLFGAIMVAIALLLPLYQVTSDAMNETANLKTRYTIINGKMQSMQAEIKRREPMKKAIEEYQTIVNMGGGFTEDIKVINNTAGGLGIEVKSISHEGKAITVNCEADNSTVFDNYVTALEKSGRFLTPIPPPEGYPYTTGGTVKLTPKPAK